MSLHSRSVYWPKMDQHCVFLLMHMYIIGTFKHTAGIAIIVYRFFYIPSLQFSRPIWNTSLSIYMQIVWLLSHYCAKILSLKTMYMHCKYTADTTQFHYIRLSELSSFILRTLYNTIEWHYYGFLAHWSYRIFRRR